MARFLVIGEYVEPGPAFTAQQTVMMIEQLITPSLEMLAKWEEEGRVKGGLVAGEREGAFIMEAASSEEIGGMLRSLPFWGLLKWQVKPLQTLRSAMEQDRKSVEAARAAVNK